MKNTKVKRFSTVLALSMMLAGGVLGLGLPAGAVTHSSEATVRSAHHLRVHTHFWIYGGGGQRPGGPTSPICCPTC
jgi:hypothetical protein